MLGLTALSLLALHASSTFAQVQPTTPGPNETYTAGSECAIAWNVDTSGVWKNMTIDLMSGSNDNMSVVANVASDLDGTDKTLTPYNWTCPSVDPYSAIYFYQFTNNGNNSEEAWTTRFTIASPSNETQPPQYSEQPDGSPGAWGLGHLAGLDTADAQPSAQASQTAALAHPPTAPLPTLTLTDASGPQSDSRHDHKSHTFDSDGVLSGNAGASATPRPAQPSAGLSGGGVPAQQPLSGTAPDPNASGISSASQLSDGVCKCYGAMENTGVSLHMRLAGYGCEAAVLLAALLAIVTSAYV